MASCWEGTSELGLTTTIGGAGEEGENVAAAADVACAPERRSGVAGPFSCCGETPDTLEPDPPLRDSEEEEDDAAGLDPPMFERPPLPEDAVAVALEAAGGRGLAVFGGGGGGVLSLSGACVLDLDDDEFRESNDRFNPFIFEVPV